MNVMDKKDIVIKSLSHYARARIKM